MRLTSHPLWQVGFRPFFTLACLAGCCLPPLWSLIFGGQLAPPDIPFSPIQWHAHEMFFGFGWAVLGGFLLTSTKNWVGIRGYHGLALLLLAAAWLVERVAMSFGGHWPTPLFVLANNAFLVSIVAMLSWTLIRHHDSDDYRTDNVFFLLMLPAFIVAKHLLLSGEDFIAGFTMTIGLFRLAFLLMLERTLTQFMKAAFQVSILRHPKLDMAIKLLGLLLALEFLLPLPLAAELAVALAALLGIRFCFWKPHLGLRRIDIGIMYIGYLVIVAQLLVDASGHLVNLVWVGSLSAHLFTVGVVGCIVPAMIIRISKGHTGRKVVFERLDRLTLYLMLTTLLVRVGLPQWLPDHYPLWIYLSASIWGLAYGILAWRTIPLLMQPRVDGREH